MYTNDGPSTEQTTTRATNLVNNATSKKDELELPPSVAPVKHGRVKPIELKTRKTVQRIFPEDTSTVPASEQPANPYWQYTQSVAELLNKKDEIIRNQADLIEQLEQHIQYLKLRIDTLEEEKFNREIATVQEQDERDDQVKEIVKELENALQAPVTNKRKSLFDLKNLVVSDSSTSLQDTLRKNQKAIQDLKQKLSEMNVSETSTSTSAQSSVLITDMAKPTASDAKNVKALVKQYENLKEKNPPLLRTRSAFELPSELEANQSSNSSATGPKSNHTSYSLRVRNKK